MAIKSDRKKLVEKLDREFSLFIRNRDKKCVTCNSVEKLTCGHVFSRVAYSTRWDESNAFAQCWGCNYKHEMDAYPLMSYAENVLGKEGLEKLHQKYATPTKFKDFELQELLDYYKAKNRA